MSSDSSLSGELIRQSTDAVGSFLRWVAELIVQRNWFSLLVLVAIASIFLFNPTSGIAFKALGIEASLPASYSKWFWIGEAAIFALALVIAVRTMPRTLSASEADTAERKAIKGLRPFDIDDAEVFAQLQRQQNLRDCLDTITAGSFRFGILHGESGCGKTSFLQAGILPKLRLKQTDAEEEAQSRPCKAVGVYVRFSDQEPVGTIGKAIAQQLEIPLSWLLTESGQTPELTVMLGKVAETLDQPLVLLLDQFEQFFVHYKRKEQRSHFIQALNRWYRSEPLSLIRIVVSIRSDLMYQLDELHQVLRYSLAPQDVFRLEKFTPAEASRVLEAIAQTESLEFNRAFVTELAQTELASREDGRISPVDLQILAWMIERQTANELRAFNRSAFEKFGGVEGLLQRFLARSLEARVTEGQRQSVVKVLLALTDLERQVRAGMLTVAELTAKLKGSAAAEEVREAIVWLSRGDVRLITPQKKNEETAYELAHERLIPALMRQAGKELTDVDKANQLMDRRVNEWLGNRCNRRYFFGLRELWLLRQQQAYLVWGSKREQKEKLLRLSQRRVLAGLAMLLALVVGMSGFAGWLNLTTAGQIQQAKWQLAGLLNKANDVRVAQAAVAFAKNDQWDRAFGLVDKHILADRDQEVASKGRDYSLVLALEEAADTLVRMKDEISTQPKLNSLVDYASRIKGAAFRSSVLSAIASASVELGDESQALSVLSDSLKVAQTIQDDGYKSNALSAIANTAARLPSSDVMSLLESVLDSAHRENASFPMVTVANLYAQQSEWGKAFRSLSRSREQDKTQGLTQLLTTFAEFNHPQLIKAPVVLLDELKVESDVLTVMIQSFDQDCQNYTDWWEVITPQGDLIAREIIKDVHSESASFSSQLSIAGLDPQQDIIIRAHFSGSYDRSRSTASYSDQALQGTLDSGLTSIRLSKDFASQLAKVEPLPTGKLCSF